jgi:hypothetical protein
MPDQQHTRQHTIDAADDALRGLLLRHGVDPAPRTPEAQRHRAIELRQAGMTIRDVAREVAVPVSTVGRWVQNVPVVA